MVGFPVSGGSTSTIPIIGVTGADPTGNTDSTAAVQAAATLAAGMGTWSLNNTAGAAIMLPPGSYLLNSSNTPLLLAPGVQLLGSGKSNTMITCAAGTNTDMITNGVMDVNGVMQNAFAAYSGTDVTPSPFVITSVSGSGPTYTLNTTPWTNTAPVIMAVGMMGYLTGSGTANQQVYTVTAFNAGAGTINIKVPPALGAPNTGSFFIIPGAVGTLIGNMTINGNQNGAGTRQGGGWNVRLYGQGHTLQQCVLINGATGNLYSEGSANSGSFTWPQAAGVPMYDVQVSSAQGVSGVTNSGYGIEWQGPHDSKWFNVSSSANNAHGLWITGSRTGQATATKMFGCYFFFNNTAQGNFTNVFVDAGANATSMYDCQVGQVQPHGGGLYEMWVDANGFDMVGGEIIEAASSTNNGIRFGNQGNITGCNFLRTLMGPVGSQIAACFNLIGDNGGNVFDVIGGTCGQGWVTNGPNLKSSFHVRGTVNSVVNLGILAAGQMPNGSLSLALPLAASQSPATLATDNLILISVTGVTGAGALTVVINSNAAGNNGQTLTIPVPTGASTYGPFLLNPGKYITVSTTATGGTFTWSGIGQ